MRLVQMSADAGDTGSALAQLAELRIACRRDDGLSRFEIDIDSIEFDVLVAAGDRAGAAQVAERLAERGAIAASTRAGELFEQIGDSKRAAAAYSHPAIPRFVSEYCRARLKARNAEIDTALELLESALTEAREDVLARVHTDRKAWAACREDARFRSLVDRREQSVAQPAR